MSNTMWIAGRPIKTGTYSWGFGGIFTTKEQAIAVCENADDFIYEIVVDRDYMAGKELVEVQPEFPLSKNNRNLN